MSAIKRLPSTPRDYPLYSITHIDRDAEDLVSVCEDAKRTEAVDALITYVSSPDLAKWEIDMFVESTYATLKRLSKPGVYHLIAMGMEFDLIVT